MLGQPIRGADNVEALVWRAVLIFVSTVFPDHRIVGVLRMQRIDQRAFDWLIVLRERPVCHT